MISVDAQLEALLRLVLAGIAGAVIGLEREVEDKPAGVRTFGTVALGAALFTVAPLKFKVPVAFARGIYARTGLITYGEKNT